MELRIEHGLPIPEVRSPDRNSKYGLLRFMSVGDSLLVPGMTARSQIGTTLRNAQRGGKRFETRREAGGLRVWRTK